MDSSRNLFKDRPLKNCIEHLEELLASSEDKENVLPALNALIENLIESNRMFDIASIYIFLKSAAANGKEIGFCFEHANRILKQNINDLFTKSITYNNTELRETFSDILGNDTGRLMELVSFIFRKYRLFEMKFSDNIHKQLIKVAEKDIHSFIEHADSNFLAFYLSTLPELSFVSRDHIERWIHIILYQIDGAGYTQKILDAMGIHPSFNFLLIFMLSPREHDRFRALSTMKEALSLKRRDNGFRNLFVKNSPYFIRKAVIESAFYDFHEIPIAHKELFSQLICFTDGKPVKDVIIPLLKTENAGKYRKITESKLAFVPAIGNFADEIPDLKPLLTLILRDPGVEIEVKEAVRKIVYGKNER
ncbi:hypothetical protein J6Z19_00945 [bacterium]|nr:hypothetical protein [bacterium]